MLDGMRTLQEFRKRLGPFAQKYTAAQLEQLQRDMGSMAQLLVNLYLAEKAKRCRLDTPLTPDKIGDKGRNLKTKLRG